jgi:hypothetical protein
MDDVWLKIASVSALLAIGFTIIFSPIFSAIFRYRVSRLMAQSSNNSSTLLGRNKMSVGARRPPPLLFDVTDQSEAVVTQSYGSLARAAQRARRSLMIAYCLAGMGNLAVLASAFVLSNLNILTKANGWARGAMIGVAVIVLALPTVIALLHLASASRLRQLVTAVGIVTCVYLLLGTLQDLSIAVFQLHLVVPLAIYSLFNLRFWRGFAPLTFLVMVTAGFGWVLGVSAWSSLGFVPEWPWIPRLAGFLVGAGIGLMVLRNLGRYFQAGGISDQEIFLDTWYFIFTIVQTVIFILTSKNILFLATILAFPAYLIIKRISLRFLLKSRSEGAPRLLLLRVFGHSQRTERLFDEFTLPWRTVGSIELIAGPDMALRNVEPSDFAAFLSGRLAARYITDPSEVEVNGSPKVETATPDGRFPLRQFYCLADTWLSVIRSRVRYCDVVVMDLRGFTEDRHGCRLELEYLAAEFPDKPVVLVVDDKTNMVLLAQIAGAPLKTPIPAAAQAWLLLADRSRRAIDGYKGFECVAQRMLVQGRTSTGRISPR